MDGILGKKIGMTRWFRENGDSLGVTVIEAGPCVVVSRRTVQTHGYDGVQLGYNPSGARKPKLTRARAGHLKKNGLEPKWKIVREFRTEFGSEAVPRKGGEEQEAPPSGQEIQCDIFSAGEFVDVRGVSKGKGFSGVVKRWGFKGGPGSHGQGHTLRAPGSIGQSSYPSRVFPGMKMAGRMGNRRRAAQGLEVLSVQPEKNLIVLKGSVPGPEGGIVTLTRTVLCAKQKAVESGQRKADSKEDKAEGKQKQAVK